MADRLRQSRIKGQSAQADFPTTTDVRGKDIGDKPIPLQIPYQIIAKHYQLPINKRTNRTGELWLAHKNNSKLIVKTLKNQPGLKPPEVKLSQAETLAKEGSPILAI